jgi:tRNA(Arg) A34 adenosine deaminase TadA
MQIKYLYMAAKEASRKIDKRSFLVGAIGIRSDGVVVRSRNEITQVPMPSAHAEARLTKKLDKNSEVYVARVLRSGDWAMAKPCVHCLKSLAKKKVKRVFYTISPSEYGVIDDVLLYLKKPSEPIKDVLCYCR